MEKLSGILPSNARIKSVDIDDSHPARPGAPSHGRKDGLTSSMRDRLSISAQAKDLAFNDSIAKKNPRDTPAHKIVDGITEKFFQSRIKPVDESIGAQTLSNQVAESNVEVMETVSANSLDKYA